MRTVAALATDGLVVAKDLKREIKKTQPIATCTQKVRRTMDGFEKITDLTARRFELIYEDNPLMRLDEGDRKHSSFDLFR